MDPDTGIRIFTRSNISYLSIYNLSVVREGIYECKVEYPLHSTFPRSALYSIFVQGKNLDLIQTRMVIFK